LAARERFEQATLRTEGTDSHHLATTPNGVALPSHDSGYSLPFVAL